MHETNILSEGFVKLSCAGKTQQGIYVVRLHRDAADDLSHIHSSSLICLHLSSVGEISQCCFFSSCNVSLPFFCLPAFIPVSPSHSISTTDCLPVQPSTLACSLMAVTGVLPGA